MPDNPIKVGERIRTVRKGLKLTQEGLAEKSGISSNYLGQVERGERQPSLNTLERIAKGLSVETDYIVKTPNNDLEEALWEIKKVAKTTKNVNTLLKIAKVLFQ